MNTKRATIVFLLALTLIVLAFAFVITYPFLKPFAFAIILAVVFHPVHERVVRWTKRGPNVSSLLSTLLLIFLFGVPTFIIFMLAANEALAAAHYLGRRSAEEGGFALFIMTLADRPLRFVGRWVDLSKYDVNAIVASKRAEAKHVDVRFRGRLPKQCGAFHYRFLDYLRCRVLPVSRREVVGLSRGSTAAT